MKTCASGPSEEPRQRKGGRPRAPEPGVPMTVYVPISVYDQLASTSSRNGFRSVSSFVRQLLIVCLHSRS